VCSSDLRFASISFSCAALPPIRAPLVGFGMVPSCVSAPAVSGTGVSIRAGGRLSEIRTGPRGDLSGGCGGPPCGGPSAEQSVLLGLYEPGIRVVVRAEGVRGGSGVESRRAVFQREPH